MKTTADFLDDLRAKLGATSDGKLALALKLDRQQVSRWRQQKNAFDDDTALKFAAQLGIEPDYIMACMAVQRSRTPEARSAWSRIAAKVAACIMFGIALGAPSPEAGAILHKTFHGTTPASPAGPIYTYATKRARQRTRRAWAALFAFLRVLGLTLALAAPAAARDWSQADQVREGLFLAFSALDWRQTSWIATHGPRYYERNPLLPAHPTLGEVNRYFALGAIMHLAIADALPADYRAAFQYVSIGIEGALVARNYRMGIRIEF